MPIDPSILQGLTNPATVKRADPLAEYTNFLQASHLQDQISAARQGREDLVNQNALIKRNTRNGKIDRTTLFPDAAESGMGTIGMGLQAKLAEQDEAENKANKEQALTEETKLKSLHELMKIDVMKAGRLSLDPVIGQRQAWADFQDGLKNELVAGMIGDKEAASRNKAAEIFAAAQSPEKWKQYVGYIGSEGASKLDSLKNKIMQVKSGKREELVAVNELNPANPQTVWRGEDIPDKPGTKIDVNLPAQHTLTEFEKVVGKHQGDKFVALDTANDNAPDIIENVGKMRSKLDAAYTGKGAGIKTDIAGVATALGLTGFENELQASEVLRKYLAKNVFDTITMMKSAGLPISRLTNMELMLTKEGAPSQNMNKASITELLDEMEDGARKVQAKYARLNATLSSNNKTAPALGAVSMDAPEQYESLADLSQEQRNKLRDRLTKNPGLAIEFDGRFGPGSAKGLIGGTSTGGSPFPVGQ